MRNGKPPTHLVDEPDRRALVAGVIDLQDANARAIIDGRELVEPLSGAGDPLEELHVELQPVSRQGLLIALPPCAVPLMLLVGGQAVHPVAAENSMHGRPRHRHLMKAL